MLSITFFIYKKEHMCIELLVYFWYGDLHASVISLFPVLINVFVLYVVNFKINWLRSAAADYRNASKK